MTAKIKLNAASGGGSFSLQAPSSSSNNRVFTIPDEADATLLTSNTSTGKVLQVVSAVKTDTASASVSRTSDWVGHGLSVAITPSSASNKILISGSISVGQIAGDNGCANLVLYKAGSALTGATGDASSNRKRTTSGVEIDFGFGIETIVFQYLDTAGGTSSITYQPALNTHHGSGQQMYLNRTYGDTADESYVRSISVMTAMEIAA